MWAVGSSEKISGKHPYSSNQYSKYLHKFARLSAFEQSEEVNRLSIRSLLYTFFNQIASMLEGQTAGYLN